MELLKSDLIRLQSCAIASSSKRTYLNGQTSYEKFCHAFNFKQYPLSEPTLRLFVTFLARSLSYSSIKTYLAAVRYKNTELGFSRDLQNMPLLHLLLRGVKRAKGELIRPNRFARNTLPIMKSLKEVLRKAHYIERDKLMLWAAFTTAFFGFLRSSEFCSESPVSFNPCATLLVSDVSFNDGIFILSIKVSKADPFRHGHSIRLSPSSTSVCPVRALQKHLSLCNDKSKPLFSFHDGRYLTCGLLSETLRSLLHATPHKGNYTSHSFRIGAASTAAAANIPDWLIKVLGRWSSDCYQRYIRTPSNIIDGVSRKLANTALVQANGWQP